MNASVSNQAFDQAHGRLKNVHLSKFSALCPDVLADKPHSRFDTKIFSKKVWLIRPCLQYLLNQLMQNNRKQDGVIGENELPCCWDWICNILPQKIVLHKLNSNLLVNLHNQQTWSPDHCFFAHLPSHLALYKNIVISLQTLSKELTIHERLAPEITHSISTHHFQLILHPPLPPGNFQETAYFSLKPLAFDTPSPWRFYGLL